MPPILVPMVASAQPLTQHSFARVHQPSTAKPANKTSMNVPRLPLPVRMVVCVWTRWVHSTAAALNSTPASTVRPSTCRAAPRHAKMEAHVSRRETPPMTVAAFQVTCTNTVLHPLIIPNTVDLLGLWSSCTTAHWFFCCPITSVDLKSCL